MTSCHPAAVQSVEDVDRCLGNDQHKLQSWARAWQLQDPSNPAFRYSDAGISIEVVLLVSKGPIKTGPETTLSFDALKELGYSSPAADQTGRLTAISKNGEALDLMSAEDRWSLAADFITALNGALAKDASAAPRRRNLAKGLEMYMDAVTEVAKRLENARSNPRTNL